MIAWNDGKCVLFFTLLSETALEWLGKLCEKQLLVGCP